MDTWLLSVICMCTQGRLLLYSGMYTDYSFMLFNNYYFSITRMLKSHSKQLHEIMGSKEKISLTGDK